MSPPEVNKTREDRKMTKTEEQILKDKEKKEQELKDKDRVLPLSTGEQKILDELDAERKVKDEEEATLEGKDKNKGGSSHADDVKDKDKDKKPPNKEDGKPDPTQDEHGVSYYNRYKEKERKLADAEALLRTDGQRPPEKLPAEQQKEFRKNMIDKIIEQNPSLTEDAANAIVDTTINISSGMVAGAMNPHIDMVADFHTSKALRLHEDSEFISSHKDEIEKILETIPIQARMNKEGAKIAVKNAILHVKGQTMDGMKEDIKRQIDEGVQDILKDRSIIIEDNQGSSGGRGSGSGAEASALTTKQKVDAQDRGLSDSVYLGLLRKRQASAKKAKRDIPDSLS